MSAIPKTNAEVQIVPPPGSMNYGGHVVADRGYRPSIVGEVWQIPGSTTLLAVERVDRKTVNVMQDRVVRQKRKRFNFQPTQRPPSPAHATELKRAIATGFFRYTNGASFVVFDDAGYVVDGGSRLEALSQYFKDHPDETRDILVVTGVSRADAATYDRGRMRTRNQILKYLEINPGQKDVLACVQSMMTLRTRMTDRLLPEEIRDLYVAHGDDIEEAMAYLHKRKSLRTNPASNYGISRPMSGGLLRGYLAAKTMGDERAQDMLQLFDALKTEQTTRIVEDAVRLKRFIDFQRQLMKGTNGRPKDAYRSGEALAWFWLHGSEPKAEGELFPLAAVGEKGGA